MLAELQSGTFDWPEHRDKTLKTGTVRLNWDAKNFNREEGAWTSKAIKSVWHILVTRQH